MSAGPDWDVFLAYASPDEARARPLYDALVAGGLRVCFDREVVKPGDDWHALLPAYLRSSSVVVLLVSEHTDAAHYEISELVEAVNLVRQQRQRLIPVRLAEDVDLPYGTGQLQPADMFTDAAVADVAAQIAALVPHQPATTGRVFCPRIPVTSLYFTGREELLNRLSSSLVGGSATVLTAGMGGVGKTTVAAALAERHRDNFDVVWWVRSEDPGLLVADLAELAPHIGAPQRDDPADTAREVRDRLTTTNDRWLIVFDNAPTEQDVAEWLPRRGQGSVILTSRSPIFSLGSVEPIDTFEDDVAEAFLRTRVARDINEDLQPVLDRLGGLPLALEQAGAWVAKIPNRKFADFVARYDDAAKEPFTDDTRPTGYDHTAATTWRVSLDAAVEQAALAGKVLEVLSYFAPEPVPCQWLREMADDEYFQEAGPDAIAEALEALHSYSLATITPEDTIEVHRLIQSTTRRNATPASVATAIRTLYRQCIGDPEDAQHWPTLRRVAPHASAVAEHSRPSVLSSPPGVWILRSTAPHAVALADQAHPELPSSARDLARLLNRIGLFQRASGAVADGVRSAALVAETLAERLGPDDPGMLTARSNLAKAYQSAGDLDRAIPLLEATLAGRERVLGNDHPDTLSARNNLANGYEQAGDLDRAIPLYNATLADLRRILGNDHPDTLGTRNNLGTAYLASGNLNRAIPLLEATLAGRERALGYDHLDTLVSRNNLAKAYESAGDSDRAIPLFEATHADRQRTLGNHHPHTLGAHNNLATAYLAAGDVHRAVPALEATLADTQRILGNDHPMTRTIRNNLGVAYARAHDHVRAIPLFEHNLAETLRVLGEGHPDTVAALEHLEQAKTLARNEGE